MQSRLRDSGERQDTEMDYKRTVREEERGQVMERKRIGGLETKGESLYMSVLSMMVYTRGNLHSGECLLM